MKREAGKKILVVLAAVLLVVVFQISIAPSASGALYSWPSTPSITDPTGDAGSPGRDITQAFWAFDGTDYFFRMDLLGPGFSNNSYYEFYFDKDMNNTTGGSPTGSGLNGIDVFVSIFFNNSGSFVNSNLQTWNSVASNWNAPVAPVGFNSNDTSPYFLEWQVASGTLGSGPLTWWGATRNNGGNLIDITSPVTTPIPSAAWLFATGTIALLALRRKRNEA